MRQFIVEKENLKNGLIELIGKDFRYLRQVLRVKKGDMLNVRFDDGSLQGTTVAFIDDRAKKITLQICELSGGADNTITRGVQASEIEGSASEENRVNYLLMQFIPKAQKFELILRQAVECGVAFVLPVIGEFSEKNAGNMFQGAKRERFERIIREARQQSGSPLATKLMEPVNLESAVSWWNDFCKDQNANLNLVLWERTEGEVPLFELIKSKSGNEKIKNVAIAVGNEGGISPAEIKLLKEKGFFSTIHFETNILRCETASLYGIAAVQTAVSQLQK